MPSAGKQSAPWSEVSAFYAHFLNFVTYKEFTWVDEYNPASAPNRKVRTVRHGGMMGLEYRV